MSRPAPRARRWPDLLIGLLVALLLLGFGLLLFRPENRAPSTATTAPASSGTGNAGIPSAPASSTPDTTAPAPTPVEPPTIAAAPVEATPPVAATPASTPATDTAASPSAGTPATPDPATPAASPSTPRAGGAIATSERRVPRRSDYRITLGTFSSTQAATSAAAPVSTLGYTVYPIDLGSQVVAQIGPFADEASARQALADIQRAYPRALLYPPRGTSISSSSGSSPSGSDTSTGGSQAAATPSTPAAAPSGPVYLQVGAFDRVESAQKLVQQLRDLGYSPTVNAPEGKKVTVLVGPYSGSAVTRTESRLSASGFDHFRVR